MQKMAMMFSDAEKERLADMGISCYDLRDAIMYGIDMGTGVMNDELIEFSPDGKIELIASLDHPVFPRALPIQLKGIAV